MPVDLVEIVDENDFVVGIATRKEMRTKMLRHRTSFVLVFNSRGEIFITKRASCKDYEPGKWEIGQGGVMEQGETYEENAKRELMEELGIESSLEYLFDFHFDSERVRYIAKAYRTKHNGPFELQKNEIEEGKWITLDALRKEIEQNPERFTEDSPEFLREYEARIATRVR